MRFVKSVPFLWTAGILLRTSTAVAQGYGPTSPTTTTVTASPATAYTRSPSDTITLTAAVTPGATGSVTFQDAGVNLSCSGGNPATLSGGAAACLTSFSPQGVHVLSATYGGDSTFASSTGSVNVFTKDHASSVGTTYCNAGAVFANGANGANGQSSRPHANSPSVIVVGDGVNSSISGSVSTLALELVDFSAANNALNTTHLLLIAPDGLHAYDFLSGVGSNASAGNYFFDDQAAQVPPADISPGTYAPAAYGTLPHLFSPAPPAPQMPPSLLYAAPAGNSTFRSAFTGVAADGAWSLYIYDSGSANVPATAAGGWCLTITPAMGHPTTTAVTSSPTPQAALGQSVALTATVSRPSTSSVGPPSPGTPSSGAVTFTENGHPLIGAPDGGMAKLVNGVATISTTGLPEGDHAISVSYHDGTGTFNDSSGTVTVRVDNATSAPTMSLGAWTYCNTGAIGIPAGATTLGDIAPAQPNPSNISVTNLPGTISSMSLTLNGLSLANAAGESLETLLAGPNGGSAPTPAQTFDCFSLRDFSSVGDFSFVDSQAGTNSVPRNLVFSDNFPAASPTSALRSQTGPASYGDAARSYTASPFFSLPASFQYAAPRGGFTFNTGTLNSAGGGVYSGTNPDGTWSLYFGRNPHRIAGEVSGGWCLSFIENEVTGTGTTASVGPSPNNRMVQGGSGGVTLSLKNEGDSNGNGSTGDPDGNHGMLVSGSLPNGLTLGTVPTGSPWNCTALGPTSVSCLSDSAVAAGSDYPLLALPVSAVHGAPATVTVSGFTFGGAGMNPGTFSPDTIAIDPAPLLAILNAHTGALTQGSTADWTIQVSNTAGQVSNTAGQVSNTAGQVSNTAGQVSNTSGAAAGTTSAVTVEDTLPLGYTLAAYSGSGWTCAVGTPVSCTSTSVGGGGDFSPLTLTVNVPSNSPTSVTNRAKVFGGGDPVHTNSTNAAAASDTATVVQVPATIGLTAGNNQSVVIGESFPANLSVTVLDAGNVAIGGLAVTFAPPAAGASGTFAGGTNAITVTTNSSGVATATLYTANSNASGAYHIGVSAGSISNNFSETNLAGSASSMTANEGTTPQLGHVNMPLSKPPGVTVKGAGSNPVPGVSVTCSAPPTGASGKFTNNATRITVVTDASGRAAAPFTANSTVGGPSTLTASARGLATVKFSVTISTSGPLTILANPTDTTVNAGATATFTAQAIGIPTPTVQWQGSTDGGATYTNVSGATSTTLSFTAASSQNGNKYQAVFTNTSGSATTTSATLTVNFAPTVTTNPVNQSVNSGSTATFTAAASANPASTVQWQVSTDGGSTFINVSGATSTTLSFTTSSTQNSNQYRAVFSNSVGTATTNTATLTVFQAPLILTNPTNSTVNAGATASFTAAANGTPTPPVQWQVSSDGGSTFTNVSGATSTTLSFMAASSQNGNKFRAVFTNASGSAATAAATLTVDFAPTVTTNPLNQSVMAGSTATFTATADGNPIPTVQWQVSSDGGSTFTNVSGATSTTLGFTASSTQNGNQYRAVFTNSAGTATTSSATLTVGSIPVISTSPTNTTVNAGATAMFTAAATGNPTPTVQWLVSTDGGATYSNVSGATLTTLSFTAMSSQNGNKYKAVFTNTNGSATTATATLTVDFAPTVTTNPVNQSVISGSTATFTAAASGNPTPTVQWQVSTDGGATFTNVSGATSTTLSFAASTTQNGNQYRAVFSNSVGTATTSAATLTVGSIPVISASPVSTTVNAGATATFTAAASGNPAPTVQWQLSIDGGATYSNVSGTTSTTLNFTATSNQNGNKYKAVFTNTNGSATTATATLTVDFAPTVTTNPVSQVIPAGSTATFTAAAGGNPTPTVQWQVSTNSGSTFTNVSGGTSTTLSFTVSNTQTGNEYRAVFSNSVGTATTSTATLMVGSIPVISTSPASSTVSVGATVTFTAAATGSPSPTVQWQVLPSGGTFTDVPGATSTTLSFTATSSLNGNKYQAVFTNANGQATTGSALLTVNFGPIVTTNPASQSVGAGSTATFTAAASGNPTPTVQWQVSTNGGSTFTYISGATLPALSFTVSAGQSGNRYRAVFGNYLGTAATTAATLTVPASIAIVTNPANTTVNTGSAATFTASATGATAVQWQVSIDGGATFSNVSGATSTTLSFTAASSQNGNKYQAVFTNSGGSATTTAATLTVDFAPTVTANPANTTVTAGSTATFTAAASGNPAPAVQWQVSTNGGGTFTNVSGATLAALSFTASTAQSGNQYRAVFTNSVGAATTTAATLAVIAAGSPCDLQQNGSITVADVQLLINQALGVTAPTNDLSADGLVNVVDVQIEIDAVLGFGCSAS